MGESGKESQKAPERESPLVYLAAGGWVPQPIQAPTRATWPQRGDRYALSESRINTDSARESDSVLPFAPEERYVYSSATHPIPALQRSAMCALSESQITPIKRKTPIKKPSRYPTIEFVGVGFPNPSGEETSPLRWMPRLEFWCVGAFRSRGAICL